jgi:hypothetical protein
MNLESQWITGFVDGEGCFSIEITPNKTLKTGYQVLPSFVVSQSKRSYHVLYGLKNFFQTGVVRKESNRKGETGRQYRVRNFNDLRQIIIPFFEKHSLKTSKKIDFVKFRYVCFLMARKEHLTHEGILKIYKIVCTMNTSKKRNFRKIPDFSKVFGEPPLLHSMPPGSKLESTNPLIHSN